MKIKWFQVDVRTPPIGERVLVYPVSEEVAIAVYMGDEWQNDYDGDTDIGTPTHWSYLPELPELIRKRK